MLQNIILANNKLQELLNEFSMIPMLRVLKLSNNRIVHLPKTFKHFSKIQEIDFSYNQSNNESCLQLDMNLSTLKLFNLSYNNVEEVATQFIENLINIEVLDLSNNNIHSLPKKVKNKLSHLHTIKK